jgi:hypothetical protein
MSVAALSLRRAYNISTMKGPGNRLKFVIRRAWECTRCQRRVVTPGSVVYQSCTCTPADAPGGPAWMCLIEDPLLPRMPERPT